MTRTLTPRERLQDVWYIVLNQIRWGKEWCKFPKENPRKKVWVYKEFRIKLKNLALKNYISFLTGLICNWNLFLMETDPAPIQQQPHFSPLPALPVQVAPVWTDSSPPIVFPLLSVQPGKKVCASFMVQVRIPSPTWWGPGHPSHPHGGASGNRDPCSSKGTDRSLLPHLPHLKMYVEGTI